LGGSKPAKAARGPSPQYICLTLAVGRRSSRQTLRPLPAQAKTVGLNLPRSVDSTTLLLRRRTCSLGEFSSFRVANWTAMRPITVDGKRCAGLSKGRRRKKIWPPTTGETQVIAHPASRLARAGVEHRAASPPSQRGLSSGQILFPLASASTCFLPQGLPCTTLALTALNYLDEHKLTKEPLTLEISAKSYPRPGTVRPSSTIPLKHYQLSNCPHHP
jgi:hypothetical protein